MATACPPTHDNALCLGHRKKKKFIPTVFSHLVSAVNIRGRTFFIYFFKIFFIQFSGQWVWLVGGGRVEEGGKGGIRVLTSYILFGSGSETPPPTTEQEDATGNWFTCQYSTLEMRRRGLRTLSYIVFQEVIRSSYITTDATRPAHENKTYSARSGGTNQNQDSPTSTSFPQETSTRLVHRSFSKLCFCPFRTKMQLWSFQTKTGPAAFLNSNVVVWMKPGGGAGSGGGGSAGPDRAGQHKLLPPCCPQR